MEPLINPWLFYFADVVETIKIISTVVFGFSFLVFATLIVCSPSDTALKEKWKIDFKYVTIVLCISVFIFAVTPTKECVYKMIVASQITEENMKTLGETADAVADKIVDKIIKVKEQSKGE